jgi:tetratricopeptide (TPR) repeat protein
VLSAAGLGLLLAVIVLAVSSYLLWQEKEQVKRTLAERDQQFQRAEQQLERAEGNFGKAIYGIASFVEKLDELHDVSDVERLRRALLEHLEKYFLAYLEQHPDDATLCRETSWVLQEIGILYRWQGDLGRAEATFRKALAIIEAGATDPLLDDKYAVKCAQAHSYVAGVLWETGRTREAAGPFRRGLEYRRLAVRLKPDSASYQNELAWQLATCPIVELRDPRSAVQLAQKAIASEPLLDGMSWNTLGVAYYRVGAWREAVAALEKSMDLRRPGKPDDFFFLAMASWQLGEKEKAHQWYDRATASMRESRHVPLRWRRFRAEAAELLDIKEPHSEVVSPPKKVP